MLKAVITSCCRRLAALIVPETIGSRKRHALFDSKGFSLVELLVTIAIIGALAGATTWLLVGLTTVSSDTNQRLRQYTAAEQVSGFLNSRLSVTNSSSLGQKVNQADQINIIDYSDGSPDTSFNSGTGANNTVYSTTAQNDGKILIAGQFTSYNGTARNRLARLNADGSLDTAFDPGTGANNTVWSSIVQSDGKILIAGAFTAYNGFVKNYITRLNTDGSIDESFNSGGAGASGTVQNMALQSDGKIIIVGAFTSYNGTARNRVARLNADGSLDTAFNPGAGANGTVWSALVQSTGKIVIVGAFTTYNGTARNRLAGLNADGSLDTTFTPGSGANNTIHAIAAQSEGKIIIGGAFTSYNDVSRIRIARLNADGALDESFDPGSGPADGSVGHIYTILRQGADKILIGGQFKVYNGTSRPNIARLNSDGSLDNSFGTEVSNNVWAGANNTVWTSATQGDDRVLIGGSFTAYETLTTRNRIARIDRGALSEINTYPGVLPSSWAGDQLVFSSQNKCYRIMHIKRFRQLWVAESATCAALLNSRGLIRGPNQQINGSWTVASSSSVYDPVLDRLLNSQSAPSGVRTFLLAEGLATGSQPLFTYREINDNPLAVDAEAAVGSSNPLYRDSLGTNSRESIFAVGLQMTMLGNPRRAENDQRIAARNFQLNIYPNQLQLQGGG